MQTPSAHLACGEALPIVGGRQVPEVPMSSSVIIVDDDSFYAEILGDLLQMQGYEPRHYLSGAACLEALDAGEGGAVDAFILDVVMPDMDGYALCEKLRARPGCERTPILFVSSKASLEDRMRGYEAGGNDYLGKPAQPEELKAKLKLAIDGAGRRTPAATAGGAGTRADAAVAGGAGSGDAILRNFLDLTLKARTVDALATALLDVMTATGVHISLLVRGDNALFTSNDGSSSPIERELLELASQNQVMIEFNKRLIINLPVLALLVRRLPELAGTVMSSFKEHLLLLARITEQKASLLRQEAVLAVQKSYWIELLVAAEKGIEQMKSQSGLAVGTVADALEEMLLTMNEAVLDLALDEDQERQIKILMKENVGKVSAMLVGQKLSVDEVQKPFRALIDKLGKSL